MNAQIKDKALVQVRVSGSAGQGSILCGVMLAQAAASAGRVVAQSARYGAAVRSGSATANVVISKDPIDYPHVEDPDILILMSQTVYDDFEPEMTESTVVIYDPFFVVPRDKPGVEQYGIGATQGAIEAFGKTQGANVIALGALSELTGVITLENLKHEIETGPTKRFKDSNLKAMNIGVELAVAAKEGQG
jgi:2-oxoglutarate ferredoxin oxidoreductase subunit gamma